MTSQTKTEMENLRATIAALEAQRGALGDMVVDTALAPLREKLAALQGQTAPQPLPADERRLVTILFTDIVESTTLAEKLDPEEWRRIVTQLHGAAAECVSKHHGQVIQYLGDGLLALFGAQEPGEFDAENAVRAALELQQQVAGLQSQFSTALVLQPATWDLQLRIGIHTGLVVVGELGETHKEFTASGDAMNLAARLQSAAPPGGILISHDTYRYVRGVFDVTLQPPLMLKGKTEAVQTYLVRRAKPRPFRSVTRGVAGIETRTIGRERETKILQDAYGDAYENKRVVWAQMVGVTGVGKTRMLSDFDDWTELRAEDIRLLRARAFPEETDIPFALVRRLWFDRFQIAEDTPRAQAEAKWVQKFQELSGSADVEPAHALGLLVGLPFRDSPYIGALRDDPVQVRGRAFVVSRELLNALRRQMPVKLLLEDLHLVDSASWDWLTEIVLNSPEQDSLHGMMVVATARSEWQNSKKLETLARGRAKYIPLEIAPLSDADTRALALELLQRVEGVTPQVVDLLVERSEGIPYYAEEIVNWFIDRGVIDKTREPWQLHSARLRESPLPATLQHLLLTRLSALSDLERAALQRGSIFGRRFWTGGIEALGVRSGEDVLEELEPRGFVHVQPESSLAGEIEWSFAQTLLREVTYESVLRRERAALHKKAAQWLEEQAERAGRLDEFAGLLGEHFERAGETLIAADWYLRAGEHSKKQGATRETRRFLERALELLPPIERERRWRALHGHLEAVALLGDLDVWRADTDALMELAQVIGEDDKLAIAFGSRASFLHNRGELEDAARATDKAIEFAQRAGDQKLLLKAQSHKANGCVSLGEPERAMLEAEQAVARAREFGDRETLAYILNSAATCFAESGDFSKALPLLNESLALTKTVGNRIQELSVLMNLGALYLWLGMYKQARTVIEQALRIAEALGVRTTIALGYLNLGEVYWFSGDGRTARQLLERALSEAIELNWSRGQAMARNELGMVLESAGDAAGAARYHTEAREIAHKMNLQPVEYEARAGLARCALAQGNLDAARALAGEVWTYLEAHGAGAMEHPMRPYVICADIFDALGDATNARKIAAAGYAELKTRADKLSDPKARQALLENDPFHRALVEMWERTQR